MTTPIPSGVIIAWPSTVASIPSGWSRVSSLDDRYLKGTAAGVDPDVPGGAATHTHVDPGHDHSVSAHTHTGGTSGGSTAPTNAGVGNAIPTSHTHTFGALGSSSGTSGSTAGGWGTASNDPPFVRVIWLSSDGTPLGIPDGAWALWNADPIPTGWSQPAAAKNAFLKGAAAGADGGGTGGAAHLHVAAAHQHAFGNHAHTGGTSGASSSGFTANASGATIPREANTTHAHAYAGDVTSTLVGSATSADSGSTSYEPPWAKLAVVQNDTGGDDAPTGAIAAWLGLLSAIPANWRLCDGNNGTPDLRGVFVKGADALSEIGDTGGSAGHSHTAPAGHTHASDHVHSVTLTSATFTSEANFLSPGGGGGTTTPHGHAGTSGSAAGTSGSGVQTAPSTADTQPPFRTVAFIQYLGEVEVTITNPASDGDSVTTPTPTFTWSNGGTYTGPQTDYRARIFAADAATLVWDSGTVSSATASVDVPSAAQLQNGLTYYLEVAVHDSATPAGYGVSSLRRFVTAWTPPTTPTGLRVTAVSEES